MTTSPSAAVGRARAIAVAIVVGCIPAARTQVSPGPLSRAHRSLEGNAHCFRCHGARRSGGLDAQCVDCHGEIRRQQKDGRGLHAREGEKDCARCHPEHGGTDFELIPWAPDEPASFDHRRAGWPLTGRHARLKCRECHERAEFRIAPALTLAPQKKGTGSFLGLETACTSCHEDVHRTELGNDCSRCHAGSETWKVAAFDHSRARYALTGRHPTVACDKCHRAARLELPRAKDGRTVPLFRPLPFGSCADCHADPHGGRLGAACADCHTTDGFGIVPRGKFDHARTRYPLLGRHAAVACDKCHARTPRPAYDRCAACHRDPHDGQTRGADCAGCHTVDGFRPATYTVAKHDLTGYPLCGAHREVACAKCHPKSGTAVPLKPRSAHCADCHADPHGGQLAQRADGGACEGCHTTARFRPATYGLDEHRRVFALDGDHATAKCAACHAVRPGREAVAGRAKVDFHPGTACTACHEDPHRGRFDERGARPRRGGCAACHGTTSFRPSLVDGAMHALFSFPLDGAHRSVPCVECHADLRAGTGTPRVVTFENPKRRCAECHRDPHGGQFRARRGNGACETCHTADAFRPARLFDHARDGGFSLEGAHARTPCSGCHRAATVDGATVIVYRSTPRRCEDCHGRKAIKDSTGERP